jgi:uncharacterized protein with HEPN domain
MLFGRGCWKLFVGTRWTFLRGDEDRLADMLDAARAMVRFTTGKSRDHLEDEVLFWALVAQVTILGESAARVTADGRDRLPAIPWSAMVGMRNQLIHGYWSIDRDELWRTVSVDIPALISQLDAFERSSTDDR